MTGAVLQQPGPPLAAAPLLDQPALRCLLPPTPLKLAPALVLTAAAGALQTLAFVHTAAWPLPLLAIALLAALVGRATPRQAAALGWVFGCGWLGAGTWWLFISLHHYGGLPAPLAVAAVSLLSALLSINLALGMAWVARQPPVAPPGTRD